jgi:DASS family divalent anion:Na+ symporter
MMRPGSDRWRWLAPLLLGGVIWMLPHAGFDARAWGLLCLFAATVCALITRPLPAGAVVLVAITASTLLGLITLQDALAGFSNTTVWLIVAAFLFARGFTQTRLGERIAYRIIERIGGRPLRLGYAIALADLVLAPFTPSNTARAGGILFPITLNVAQVLEKEPRAPAQVEPRAFRPGGGRTGAFLLKTLYQSDLVVCAMFLTAVAPNLLLAELAFQTAGVVVTWSTWALAAVVPGLLSLLVVPYLVFRLCPPDVRETTAAQALAAERLEALGPITREQRVLVGVFSLLLLLWITGEWHGVPATAVAYVGLSLLVLTRVLDWQDVLAERGAWDALIWFGGLVMLATELQQAGFPEALAGAAAGLVGGWTWVWGLTFLVVVYLYSHYAFASMAAHVTAMFPAFFAVALGLGAPPLVAALSFGVFSSLNAGLTHYGTGPAPIIFGAGYLSQQAWWRIGFVVSLAHLAIWLPVGFLWWKLMGLW